MAAQQLENNSDEYLGFSSDPFLLEVEIGVTSGLGSPWLTFPEHILYSLIWRGE